VGVGDIGAMPCGVLGAGDAACGDDGSGAGREHDTRTLSGSWLCERFFSRQPCGYWVSIGDSARVKPRA
jgi:hypothetical protein